MLVILRWKISIYPFVLMELQDDFYYQINLPISSVLNLLNR